MGSAPLAVLVSPGAGAGRGSASGAAVVAELEALGHGVLDVTGATAEASVAAARSALDDGAAALVVVGGDGTVQLGASVVAQTGVPLAVVPAGSGNDAARALGVVVPRGPSGHRDVARRLSEDLAAASPGRAVDLLRVSPAAATSAGTTSAGDVAGTDAGPRWCVGVVAAGFDAAVNARANAWAAAGAGSAAHRLPPRARYTAAVLAELPAWRPRPYRLVLDGVVLDQDAVLVAVAGTASYGGGLRIAPAARTDDGLADVVVVRALSRPALLALLPTVFAGWHVHHPAVAVHRAARVEVALAEPSPATGGGTGPGGSGGGALVAHGDGEPLFPLPIVAEVVPGALRLLGGGAP